MFSCIPITTFSWIFKNTLVKRDDIDSKTALFYAEEADSDEVWAAVLQRIDIDTNTAISYAKKVNIKYVLDVVSQRPDVKNYLNS